KLGQEVQVWVIYWSASTTIKGFHHPDICMPNHGWTALKREVRPVELAGGRVLPVTVRHFERGGLRQQLYYWTQEGPRVWTDLDEAQAVASGPNHLWVFDRFRQGERLKQVGRLSVLI